jgi:hypothetical protein
VKYHSKNTWSKCILIHIKVKEKKVKSNLSRVGNVGEGRVNDRVKEGKYA